MSLTLEANSLGQLTWHVDAASVVHHDMQSHTGGVLLAGKGAIYSTSTKQKLNTKKSTESELVGINNVMPMILWTKDFLDAQGYDTSALTINQDN